MKSIIVCTLLLSFLFAKAQKDSSQCLPVEISLSFLQKNNINILAGANVNAIGYNSKTYRAWAGQINFSYLPARWLEIGYNFSGGSWKYPGERKFVMEHNLYLRKYLLFHSCSRAAFFANTGISADNSGLSYKGEPTSNNIFVPRIGAGIYKMLGKQFRAVASFDYCFDKKPFITQLSLLWYVMNIKTGKQKSSPLKPFNYFPQQ